MHSKSASHHANGIQIAGCYLYWWFFLRLGSGYSDFDTKVRNYFAKAQFFMSIVVPLVLMIYWVQWKVFNIPINSPNALYLLLVFAIIIVIDFTVLSKSKQLFKCFELIENRFKFDILVIFYLVFAISLIVLSIFKLPHRIA